MTPHRFNLFVIRTEEWAYTVGFHKLLSLVESDVAGKPSVQSRIEFQAITCVK